MAEKLTPQQQQAVVNRGGKLLVSAAAGSGKTKVLVDRLLHYLTDPVNPANLDEFLIITYTKAAASELRGKIAAKLSEQIALQPENRHLQRQMQRLFLTKISTVHGFCTDILREFAYRMDLTADFRVADENECREIREAVLADLLDRAYEEAGTDADFRAFVDTQGLGRDDRLVADVILKVYDSARCHLDPESWLQSCLDAAGAEGVTDASQTVWGQYLMAELFAFLDDQIRVMERCAQLADRAEGMEKVTANLRDSLQQMEWLRASASWDEIIARKAIDFRRLNFPRKNVDAEAAERIRACRDACKKALEKKLRPFADDSAQVLYDLNASAGAARGLINLVRQFDAAYAKAKKSRRCVDFGDLEHKMLDLLWGKRRRGITAVARQIGSRFREIMVDEYQDSNGVQDAIFEALTEGRDNCFMVGDVKQSIYQFRLADPGIFLEKYHTYVPAEEAASGEGRKVLLSANFRSGGEVIEAVNDVFTDCMSEVVGGLCYGEAEMLREGIPHVKLPDPAVELYGIEVDEHTYEDEPAFVAKRIAELLDGNHMVRNGGELRPIRPEDIVILLRSPGSVGRYFQQALENRGIRCTSGGGTDLLKTEEIATLRSVLQTVANPRQDIPLLSTLASPVFGFTADDLAAIRSAHKSGCFYDALCQHQTEKTRDFLAVLDLLRQEARMHPVTQLIEKIFLLTRMDSIYGAMDGGETRRANLQTFFALAADYEAASRKELGQFLETLESMEEKGLMTAGESASGAVTIMSIHKSKGLEFPVVFLSGLSREFNRESQRAQVLCDQELGLGLAVADSKKRIRYPAISKRAISSRTAAQSLSEEMRVLYVAMTRARDRLIMTYASRNLQKELQELTLRMDLSGMESVTKDVICPGKWILLSALQRSDAGAFHTLGGRPDRLRIPEHPWKIQVVTAPKPEQGTQLEDNRPLMPTDAEEKLRNALDFSYQHRAATVAPSKQTATQRKGRQKDQEAAEEANVPDLPARSWRKPAFREKARQGKAYGSAMHTALQHIRFAECSSLQSVEAEIARLVSRRLLTQEQGKLVDPVAIFQLVETEIGRKLRGANVIREFKFSILDDGSHYGPNLEDENVLLQGVVDCAILEDDGMIVIDFKTDAVTEQTLPQLVDRYRPQVQTYVRAMERIYNKPVKAALLYFFGLNQFAAV